MAPTRLQGKDVSRLDANWTKNATTISLVACRLHLCVVSWTQLPTSVPHILTSAVFWPHLFLGSFGQQTLLSGLTSSQWDLKAFFCASHTAFINRLFLSALVAIWKPVSKHQEAQGCLGTENAAKVSLQVKEDIKDVNTNVLRWLAGKCWRVASNIIPFHLHLWIWIKLEKPTGCVDALFCRWSKRMHGILTLYTLSKHVDVNFQRLFSCMVSSIYLSPTTNETHLLSAYLQKASTARTHLVRVGWSRSNRYEKSQHQQIQHVNVTCFGLWSFRIWTFIIYKSFIYCT